MLKMKYALEKGGPKRLELLWNVKPTECKIHLDGKEIGSFNDPERLKAGEEFSLDDGTCLKVQLTGRSKLFPYQIMKDGLPLSSELPGPAQRLKSTYQIMFIIAAVNLMAGLTSFRLHTSFIYFSQNRWILVAAGVIFLVLALLVMRKSKIALAIAAGLFALDTIVFLFYTILPLWGRILIFIFRLLLLFLMMQGFGAIYELKQAQNDGDKKNKSEI